MAQVKLPQSTHKTCTNVGEICLQFFDSVDLDNGQLICPPTNKGIGSEVVVYNYFLSADLVVGAK